jgi:dTDP-4-amino-4,6-dideoxygalactose transaminase
LSDPVPFVDLARSHAPIEADLRRAFDRCLRRGDFVLGEELDLFEAAFADYLGVEHCVGVASGTSALTIILAGLGIGPGQEVIVPAHTFVASALPVLHVGAVPVFCDVDPDRGLIDLASAEALITDRTSAVVPVHLYGQACDMAAVIEFGDRHGLAVVEDAAQAHGASWAGAKVGSSGTASAFSFYPSKNLGALGDGGAICTGDPALADRARALRNLGQLVKGVHDSAGFNERLDTLQAAALRLKLAHLDDWNEQRRAAAARYSAQLPAGTAPGAPPADAYDVFHVFAIRVGNRDAVGRSLAERGIGTGVHYPTTADRQPPFADPARVSLETAERWARDELSLPMFPGIREQEIDRVCGALAELL